MKFKSRIPLLFKTCIYVFIYALQAAINPDTGHAYIGPGAGFAVAGSFMVMFTAIISAIFILMTWPLRYLIRSIRYRKIWARSSCKKIVILGLDGMDHSLTTKWLDEGKLPNFARLRDQGCFKPLATTVPSISPVAWSSFQTGVNPGKHNIFDFLTRDRRTYAAKLSSTDIRGASRSFSIGKYRIPLGGADIRLLRKGIPFWKILGENGIFSNIIRVPITFPPEQFKGLQLSAMCTPDIRGTQGMFSYFSSAQPDTVDNTEGEFFNINRNGNKICGELTGPTDPMRKSEQVLTCPFEIADNNNQPAILNISGGKYQLSPGKYTPWVRVSFKGSLGVTISGICKFLLVSMTPEFKMYVTPINIDPDKPAMPISHPKVFATYLAKRQGPFATLGLAEDSWALNEKLISDDDFFEQCIQADRERETMFFDALDNVKQGLCVCVFDGTDRVQHAFWRQMDKGHPAYSGDTLASGKPAIEEIYRRADKLVGTVMQKCEAEGSLLMVISDHGFNVFRYGIDLNRWLEENGYLKLKGGGRYKKNLAGVDWSQTRAFAIGLSGIFLNLKGREAQGIVDSKTEAPHLRDEIAAKLLELQDDLRNQPVVKQVYNAWKVYTGPYKNNAPDLLVGYQVGYRSSWETAVGQVTDRVLHDNTKAWSGDHCIDPSLVPGVLFSNRPITAERPRLMDIGPTVLKLFGVGVPRHMDGKPLEVHMPEKAADNTEPPSDKQPS
ncbi:MAG: nucleotide pyrophosphatase [Deltaproteobacteria bacterium]|nr:nucleotide pyrophosphatase [Deltaproteobacteria bacterium]